MSHFFTDYSAIRDWDCRKTDTFPQSSAPLASPSLPVSSQLPSLYADASRGPVERNQIRRVLLLNQALVLACLIMAVFSLPPVTWEQLELDVAVPTVCTAWCGEMVLSVRLKLRSLQPSQICCMHACRSMCVKASPGFVWPYCKKVLKSSECSLRFIKWVPEKGKGLLAYTNTYIQTFALWAENKVIMDSHKHLFNVMCSNILAI